MSEAETGKGGGVPAHAVEALFTREGGGYAFARWARPVAPVVFGVEPGSLPVLKGAVEAVMALAGHPVADVDPELGANLMLFFVREWDELLAVPGLDRLIPDLGPLLARLGAAEANQYRVFRFDPAVEGGGIRAVVSMVRMDEEMARVPAEALALSLAAQVSLLWSDAAFRDGGPLVAGPRGVMLRPDLAAVIRAAYDPVLPAAATDPAHALRLAARTAAGRAS